MDILNFLAGPGFFLILGIILIGAYFYNRRNRK